jgi:hypothetical protein
LTAIWIIPLIVTAIGLVLIAGFARHVADEAAAFRRSTTRLGELRPALVEVRTSAQVLAEAAADLRARRRF